MQNQMWIYIYLKFILLYRRSKHWFIYEPVVLGRCVNTLAPASVTQTPIGKSSLITVLIFCVQYICKILSQTSGFLITFRVKCAFTSKLNTPAIFRHLKLRLEQFLVFPDLSHIILAIIGEYRTVHAWIEKVSSFVSLFGH